MKKVLALFPILFMATLIFGQGKTELLSSKHMLDDINILQASLTKLHPGLFRYITPSEFQYQFDLLKEKCQNKMDERKFYLMLAQLLEKIKCGHTF